MRVIEIYLYISYHYLHGFTFLVPAYPGGPGHSPWGRETVVVVVVGNHRSGLVLAILCDTSTYGPSGLKKEMITLPALLLEAWHPLGSLHTCIYAYGRVYP